MTVNSGYGFPYPLSSEPVANGASNIQSLADAVDAKMGLFKIIPTGATGGSVSSDGDVVITSGSSSIVISGAFSSLFDSYKIHMTGHTGSVAHNLQLVLGSTNTGYYGVGLYASTTAATPLAITDNNAAQFGYVGGGDQFSGTANIEIQNPFTTAHTQIFCPISAGLNFGVYTGRLANNTSYTSFTLRPQSGTFNGGTVRVYGYRN